MIAGVWINIKTRDWGLDDLGSGVSGLINNILKCYLPLMATETIS